MWAFLVVIENDLINSIKKECICVFRLKAYIGKHKIVLKKLNIHRSCYWNVSTR